MTYFKLHSLLLFYAQQLFINFHILLFYFIIVVVVFINSITINTVLLSSLIIPHKYTFIIIYMLYYTLISD